jgi:hypothetical protein
MPTYNMINNAKSRYPLREHGFGDWLFGYLVNDAVEYLCCKLIYSGDRIVERTRMEIYPNSGYTIFRMRSLQVRSLS